MADLPGSAVVDGDISIWVPNEDTPVSPLEALFVAQANDVIAQLKKIRSRNRSIKLYTKAMTAGPNWTLILQRIRVIGEVNAYIQITAQRKNNTLHVPDDGNIVNEVVATVAPGFEPESTADLGSTGTGRTLSGVIVHEGQVYLTSFNSGADLTVGQQISLGGFYPLDDYMDSYNPLTQYV